MVTRNNGKQRTGSGLVDNMDTIRWGEQAQQDAVAWHFGAKRVPRENEPAFVAGFADGWRACLSALKLHGVVVSFDRLASDVAAEKAGVK
ncbi:MAG: hypothetical protein IPH13_20360 [Planctomycetes bacterium]|nr:hypothetical protein [Planctomycetota bacterium]